MSCGCDGIGRHARFRFLCREACGFKSHQPHEHLKMAGASEKNGGFSDMRLSVVYVLLSITLHELQFAWDYVMI